MHDRRLHEQVGILALAFRAGLASRNGTSFAVKPASVWIDRHRGTDLFVVKSGEGVSKVLWVDLTEGHRMTVEKKIRQNMRKSRAGGRWIEIIHVPRESVIGIATNPCFPQAYEASVAERDMSLLALSEVCPVHGNRCSLTNELFRLSRFLNSQLTKGFRMSVPTSPLPSR